MKKNKKIQWRRKPKILFYKMKMCSRSNKEKYEKYNSKLREKEIE